MRRQMRRRRARECVLLLPPPPVPRMLPARARRRARHRAPRCSEWAAVAWRGDAPVGCIELDAPPDELLALRGDGACSASACALVRAVRANDGEALVALVRHALEAQPQLQRLLLVGGEDLAQGGLLPPPAAAAAAGLFTAVAPTGGAAAWLHAASRRDALPPLTVRAAVAEDADDLAAIVAAAAARGPCPSLAALPDACQPELPHALSRLIASQDAANVVLVAEDGAGRLMGLLAATSELDVAPLLLSFDVGLVDGFLPPDVYTDAEAAARAAATRAQVRWGRARADGVRRPRLRRRSPCPCARAA